MNLKDIVGFVRSELRAERAVSSNLISSHQFFDWKCAELDKLINELESVRNLEALKVLLNNILIFNRQQSELLSRFPGVKGQAEEEFKNISEKNLDALNCEYNRLINPSIVSLNSEDVNIDNINREVLNKFIYKVLPALNRLEKNGDNGNQLDTYYTAMDEVYNSERMENYILQSVNKFDEMMAEGKRMGIFTEEEMQEDSGRRRR